jgi:hypothetical protein
MTEKTSEDLVFEKLKTPSVPEMFSLQLAERTVDNENFNLWYIIESRPKSLRVVNSTPKEINANLVGYEFIGMQGSMPRFIKKD